ncbi:MAG: flagellar brake protein [Desulfurispora sp.]|uniref:flagellar brake protein n=1 Tax=Desulfurispora sp. TaxID=3014275 RepID=UPI00404A447D
MADITFRPQVSQKIYVQRGDSGFYTSSIEDFKSDRFFITMPYAQQVPLTLHVGDAVSVRVPTPEQVLFFDTTVVGLRRDNVPLYALAMPEKVIRQQSRRYVRLDLLHAIEIAPVPELPDQKPLFSRAEMLNISAGGAKIAHKKPLEPREQILVKFSLPVKKMVYDFQLTAEVRRCETVESPRGGKIYHIGIEFIDITERQRDRIFQFVFTKMAACKQNS